MFEQTGVVEGKIQGRLKPTGIRPKFIEKFEAQGIHLPPGIFGFTLLGRRMDPCHRSSSPARRGRDHADRLRHLHGRRGGVSSSAWSATPPAQQGRRRREGQGGLARAGRRLRRPRQLNKVVEKRDWGANLARELGARRPRSSSRPSSWPSGPARSSACRRHVPARRSSCRRSRPRSSCSSALLVGFWLPRFWLGRRKGKRLKAFNSSSPTRSR